jgi:hypothetical protein
VTRKLKYTVIVNGEAYEAGSSPEPEIADQILNPFAWEDEDAPSDTEDPGEDAPKSRRRQSTD